MSRIKPNRRGFLGSAVALGAAGLTVPYWFRGESAGAVEPTSKNDRPQIGLIGAGGRGCALGSGACKHGDIVAVCDVDREHAEGARHAFGDAAKVYVDYRELLDRKDIDVVFNATTDHWHTAINIAACQAGKDLYAEKPLTLTIDEGKILRQVVRQTGRIVQVGTQQRSGKQFQMAIDLIRTGRLGRLKRVAVSVPFWATKGGPFSPRPVPASLNWDKYQGQAPKHAYYPERTVFKFRYWCEYAGGHVCDWGAHHIDIAHWGMDVEHAGPVTVEAKAIFPNDGKPDCYNTPDRFVAQMKYPGEIPLCFLTARDDAYQQAISNGQVTDAEDARLFSDLPNELKTEKRNGILFVGEEGSIFVNRGGLYGRPTEEIKKTEAWPKDGFDLDPTAQHVANFFSCLRTRTLPRSTVEVQHRSVTACHLVNIAIRLNRKITWDPKAEQVLADAEANAMLKRKQREPYGVHL